MVEQTAMSMETYMGRRTRSGEKWAEKGTTKFALTAIQFIRVVGAVLHPVTQVALWNARPVGTLSLVIKAACRRRENTIPLN